MTDEDAPSDRESPESIAAKSAPDDLNGAPASSPPPSATLSELLPLPGLAAIALYLVLLAGIMIVGVVEGHYPPLFLLLSASLFTATGGLLMRFRWGWAMALAAVFLLACYNAWIFSSTHQPAALIQGLLNLVFVLYLIRTEVREKLR